MATLIQETMPSARSGQTASYLVATLVAVFAALSVRSGGGLVLLGASSALLAGALVMRRPVVGICIYVVTFLFTYPNFLITGGNITINNVLGVVFLGMLGLRAIRERPGWLFTDPVMVALGLGALLFILSSFSYTPLMDVSSGVVVEKGLRVRAVDTT